MKNSILGKARWLREVALATSKNNGARVAREWLKYAAMLVMLLTLGVGNAWAADVQINYSDDWAETGRSGSGGAISITKSGVSISSAKGYVSSSSVHIYNSGTFTISSSIAMTQIVFNSGGGNDIKNNFAANTGTVDGNNRKWTGSATSVTFTVSSHVEWTRATVTIDSYVFAFSKNGATEGTVPDPTYKSSYSWSATIPYHAGVNDLRNADGCSFVGWNTDKNGNGTDYVAGQTFYGSGNQTLYVKWGNCHYDVTYNTVGVTMTGTPPSSITSSDTEIEAFFTINNGYTTPIVATVTMGGYSYGSSEGFLFDESMVLFEPGSGFDGDVVFSITATEQPCTPINPSLNYSLTAMTVGQTSSPTLTGNTGGGSVSYAITSGGSHASINPSTGVVTASSAGDITVTATIGAVGNTYCANTATCNISIAAVTRTVTWHINGATSTTQVADGQRPTPPTVDVDDYCGDKFIGWTKCAISGSVGSESSVSGGGCGLYKSAATLPTISEDGINFYAVFADEKP